MSSSRSPSPENDVFSLGIIPEKVNKQAGITQVDFDGALTSPLLLHEDLKDGCGGQLWPAGMTLAKYMLTSRNDLRSKAVLEIGAGGGLVGLAVAKGRALSSRSSSSNSERKLLITDQIPMLSLMQRNISLNSLEEQTEALVYDWGSPVPAEIVTWLQTSSAEKTHPDVILAADCVYFEPAFPLLLRTLMDLIGPTTICYFCFKKRRKADMRFIKDMHRTFLVSEIQYDDKEADRRENVFLFSLGHKSVGNSNSSN